MIHLIIDGKMGNREKLYDVNIIKRLLKELPEKLSMNPICNPEIVDYKADIKEEDGVSGFVMIAESHISVHTYPEMGKVYFDIFSCKGFDMDNCIEYIKKAFELKDIKKYIIERGFKNEKSQRLFN